MSKLEFLIVIKSNKANYTPYLESIGWKEESFKDESLIIRVDNINRLPNGVLFGVVEKIKTQAGEVINKDIATPCPSKLPLHTG